jgi:hypothetical protein
MNLLSLGSFGFFQVNDWAFVAARNIEDAIKWHEKEFPGEEVDRDWCGPIFAQKPIRIEGAGLTSLEKIAGEELAKGTSLPFLAGIDGHYA